MLRARTATQSQHVAGPSCVRMETDLRIQGPHLPCGRFERTPSRSASDDHDDDSIEDASSTSHDRQGDDRADAISETWSETSLALDGPSLDTAQQFPHGPV